MDPFTKDVVQVAAWGVAILGGLIAAFKALREIAENTRLRAAELRWKKAQLAREIINHFNASRKYTDALTMLDWNGRIFEISPGQHAEVFSADLPKALQKWRDGLVFDDKEIYVRDCIRELFDNMALLEHYLRTDFLCFEDIEFPMTYHMIQTWRHWDILKPLITDHFFQLTLAFAEHFQETKTRAV